MTSNESAVMKLLSRGEAIDQFRKALRADIVDLNEGEMMKESALALLSGLDVLYALIPRQPTPAPAPITYFGGEKPPERNLNEQDQTFHQVR